jgi:hypothetical protein
MFSRTSTRWLALLLILGSFGAAFAYNRISATTTSAAVSPERGQLTTVDAPRRTHHPVVMPKIDWKPDQPWPGEWIKYAPDSELPNGLTIEVTQGVITAVATDERDKRDYDILGTRYVIGDLDATDITPALWRSLDFEMPKPDGSLAELSVLRPLWWIEETGAKVGETIDLAMHEIGITGMAKVLKVGRCEVDSRDNAKGSQIVTGKIKHHNAEVWDLVFNNDTAKPLGVTANHPIYSFDRDDWVPAGELKINEKVRTIDGTATLTSKSKRPGRETVYNLEVHRSHAYHVSQFGILAHNSSVVDCGAILKPGGVKIGVPGSSDRIRIVKGGLKDAEDMFLDLAIKGKGKDITPKGFNGMVVEFPDGGIIRFRPTSTSGPPTIDIIIKYLGIDEIKFIP